MVGSLGFQKFTLLTILNMRELGCRKGKAESLKWSVIWVTWDLLKKELYLRGLRNSIKHNIPCITGVQEGGERGQGIETYLRR